MGGSSTTTTIEAGEQLAGIQLQTSTYGSGLTLQYGRNRVAAKLIWHDDFRAIKHVEKQRSSGGKGGGGGKSTIKTESWNYEASIMFALAEGPIGGIGRCWVDKSAGALNSRATGSGWTFFRGNRSQAPWSWLTSRHASKAVGYAGTAVLANPRLDLGESGALKNYSFEITGFLSDTGFSGDAHPAQVLPDFLSNAYYGAGWDRARIGDLSDYNDYCRAMGFFISPGFSEQRPALECVADLLTATNSDAVWSDGVLKIRPYGDEPVSGNGASYSPEVTPLYDLDDDDFLRDGDEDPVQVERKSASDAHNSHPVAFSDRRQAYNESLEEEPDPVDVERFGVRQAPKRSLRMITRAGHAKQLSRILAQRSIYTKNRYTFYLGLRYALLEPMDLLTLTDRGLGLDQHPVRILAFEEDSEDRFRVVAEEWPFGIAHAALFEVQDGDGTAPDVNADPGYANPPAIFEPPAILTGGDPELWLATSGGALWGGCEIWISRDDASYQLVGAINTRARHGELTASLPSGGVGDNSNTLAVQLEGGGELSSVSAEDRDDLVTLAWVDGELLAYQSATLTGADAYDLKKFKRGCYGTPITSHAAGSGFVRMDEGIFRYALPSSRIGQQFYIKLVSVNVWGGGKQAIAEISPYVYTVTGRGLLPAGPSNCAMQISNNKPS
ncbi:phage tail protein [Microbulbifer sp. 2304DJ12-6]|uniref:phage tail protein n=1 Tax=Microbulbifer sp. 2304DJ12-6 TaxID=3233340 RepID=UPI0039AF7627